MIQLLPDIYAIEVPVDAKKVSIVNGSYTKWLKADGVKIDPINIRNKVQFLFCTLTATEEDAAKVFVSDHVNAFGDPNYDYSGDTSLQKLEATLKSHNLDPAKNWAIIKKKKI